MTMRPWFDWGQHHLVTTDALARVESGECKRQLLFQPPRTSKSTLSSLGLPGYFLGRHPDEYVMVCSYGADLAYEFSRGVRNDIREEHYPFPLELRKGQATVKQWGIAGHRGGMIAAGVGGSLTGKGASLIIIDDPVKDRQQADSPAYREKTWNWFREVAYTRLAPGGRIIVLMTRWHEGDLAGMLINEMAHGGEHYDIISLPARAYGPGTQPEWITGPDPLGRKPGEPLWPERFSEEDWARIENAVGPRGWSALEMQTPSAEQGLIFKKPWFAIEYDQNNIEALGLRRVIVVVDGAYKEGVSNSHSDITAWGESDTQMYVLDNWNDQVGFDELAEAAVAQWNRALNMTGVTPTLVIEDKASGQSLIQTIQSNTSIPVEPFPDKTDPAQKRLAAASKEARADAAIPAFKALRVSVPKSAPWKKAWIKQHLEFPTALWNDSVDTTSMAVARLYGTRMAASGSVALPSNSPESAMERFRASVYNAQRGAGLGGGARGSSAYNARRGGNR